MKATGIVRRVDELGRIVIPKEIRRTLRIREGDPMEIFTNNDGGIILKKYSPISELSVFAEQYAEALAQAIGHTVCIADKDIVVAAAGAGKKNLGEKVISKQLEELVDARGDLVANRQEKNYINVTNEGFEDFNSQTISTIICQGDAMGAVIILGKDADDALGDVELKLAKSAAILIGKQMES